MIESCPYCGNSEGFELEKRVEELRIFGMECSSEFEHYKCKSCNGVFDTCETMDKNLEAIRLEYFKKWISQGRKTNGVQTINGRGESSSSSSGSQKVEI